tara:strand:+ start:1611 stop:2984 length:1374 start_codon:yes stop_codon:yes gene_type:complete
MATFRVGVGSFNINDGSVGIGTEGGSGHGNLKVDGTLKSNDIDVLGVSTFTRYSGFSADEININNRDLTLSGEYSTTGDIVVDDGNTLTVGLGSTACVGSVECISVKHHFSVPVGDTAQRNETSGYAEGTIRFNRDLGTMEFFNGNEWRQFRYRSGAGRGYIAGGQAPGPASVLNIDLINISSLGNAVHFGNNSSTGTSMRSNVGRASSATEGFCMSDGSDATILYFTMSTQGNATEFAEQSYTDTSASLASSTRALSASASTSSKAVDYIEMSTKANAIDFGDLSVGRNELGAVSSPTRGVFCGGGAPSGTGPKSEMDFFTISSKGNAATFGELTHTRGQLGGGVSDGVRGVVAGGNGPAPTYGKKGIDYITIASTGNAIRFGELMLTRGEQAGAVCNRVRGIFCGGYVPGTKSNSMEYITIASSGNGEDFGDLTEKKDRIGGGCISDSHGGLGGY